MSNQTRCTWAGDDPLMQQYHDEEWGVPTYDDQELFEFLVLEGAQAGLSWSTILHRREGYRRAFDNFDVKKIARYNEAKKAALKEDTRIIRNKRKIEAAVTNAQAYIKIQKEFGSFSNFIWSFVGNTPIINQYKTHKEIPAQTELSRQISQELRKRGFSFVGPTIMYAYVQAVGMVCDHTTDCFCYPKER